MRGSAIVLGLLLAACGPSELEQAQSENEVLQVQVANLQNDLNEANDQLEQARTEVTALRSAADDLTSEISRFDYDDWRDVVPSVRSAAEEVESTSTAVETAVNQ